MGPISSSMAHEKHLTSDDRVAAPAQTSFRDPKVSEAGDAKTISVKEDGPVPILSFELARPIRVKSDDAEGPSVIERNLNYILPNSAPNEDGEKKSQLIEQTTSFNE